MTQFNAGSADGAPAREALPPLLSAASDAQPLLALLADAGYSEAGICARLGCTGLTNLRERPGHVPADALDILICWFLESAKTPTALAQRLVGAEMMRSLERLRLLASDAATQTCHAPLALYPLRGLYLISDQADVVVGRPGEDVVADVVFPAHSATTAEFLDAAPAGPCEALLDLGAGTGVAALLAARDYAAHAWAIDITERATQMALWNAHANGINNVTVLCGDLYEPVAGLTFDSIISHPPYMPVPESKIIFRDGGADGEQITRRIIEGLPQFLRPGGRFYCRCLATDRNNAPLEQRLRAMLGEQHAEFDVVLITNITQPPSWFYCSQVAHGNMPASVLEDQLRMFQKIEAENLVVGFIYIERHQTTKTPRTLRRRLGPRQATPIPGSVEKLLAWEHMAALPEVNRRLLDSRPILSEHAQVQIVHRRQDGFLQPVSGSVSTETPFAFGLESSPGLGMLLASCNGQNTVIELHDQMRNTGAIPPETSIEKFLELIRLLIGAAIVTSDV